jgi:hypothetical protein
VGRLGNCRETTGCEREHVFNTVYRVSVPKGTSFARVQTPQAAPAWNIRGRSRSRSRAYCVLRATRTPAFQHQHLLIDHYNGLAVIEAGPHNSINSVDEHYFEKRPNLPIVLIPMIPMKAVGGNFRSSATATSASYLAAFTSRHYLSTVDRVTFAPRLEG